MVGRIASSLSEEKGVADKEGSMIPKAAEVLGLGEDDLILLNLGIGTDGMFRGMSKLNTPAEFSGARAKYDDAVRGLMTILMKPGIYTGGKLPRFVWRETVPQHFNTSNGIYDPQSQACVPLNDLSIQHGANVRNEVANSVMKELSIPVIPAWQALSISEQLHYGGPDCTHFNLDA